MTSAWRASNGRAEVASRSDPPPRSTAAPARRSPGRHAGDVSDGIVITAEVGARLLGMKLLRLSADITVRPVRASPVHAPPRTEPPLLGRPPRRPSIEARPPGGGLADAARAIAAGAHELQAARDRMP